MTSPLKRHPFPVVAWFDRVLALSFAFPEAVLRPLVPELLEIDGHDGFGFVTVALVWTRELRPAGVPAFLGQDFFLAGYRIFTRLRDENGRRLRGLKILRSETDKIPMVFAGNLMTHYNYRLVQLEETSVFSGDRIRSEGQSYPGKNAGPQRLRTVLPGRPRGLETLDITFDLSAAPPETPPDGSPFADLRAARQFAGPMPYTFDAEEDGRFVVIEGKRADWHPKPVPILSWKVALFDEPPFQGVTPVLANAFRVENVPYRWERGRLVRPMPMTMTITSDTEEVSG